MITERLLGERLLVKARDLKYAADYLIRCQHNRALPQGDKLWTRLAQAQVLGSVRFEMPLGAGAKHDQCSKASVSNNSKSVTVQEDS